MDYQIDERQNYRSSQTDGGRINGQSKDSASKQEQAQYSEIHVFVNFQNEVTENETNSSNYEAPVHPNAHSPALPKAD
jgi:hypothetical protein